MFSFQDDPRLEGYNVEERAVKFLLAIGNRASYYATNHIMLTMGEDFNYESAREWYKNLDKLIYYTNKMFVSAVSVYGVWLHAIYKFANVMYFGSSVGKKIFAVENFVKFLLCQILQWTWSHHHKYCYKLISQIFSTANISWYTVYTEYCGLISCLGQLI